MRSSACRCASVGSDTVRVSLGSRPTDAQRRALERTFGAHNVSFGEGALDIRVKDGSKALLPALQVVADQGLAVTETRVLTPTLEDVFLQYTGARFSEANEAVVPKEDEKGRKGRDAKTPVAAERTMEAAP